MVSRSIGQPVGRSVGRSVGRAVGRSVGFAHSAGLKNNRIQHSRATPLVAHLALPFSGLFRPRPPPCVLCYVCGCLFSRDVCWVPFSGGMCASSLHDLRVHLSWRVHLFYPVCDSLNTPCLPCLRGLCTFFLGFVIFSRKSVYIFMCKKGLVFVVCAFLCDILLKWCVHLFQCSFTWCLFCLLYTSPSPRDLSTSRMPSSA